MVGSRRDRAAARPASELDLAADKHLGKWRKGGVFDFGSGFVKALLVALADPHAC